MTHRILTLVTRKSQLALTQSSWVAREVERLNPGTKVDLSHVTTTGDRNSQTPFPKIGGKGLFTKELEDALLGGTAHLAVHSLKDLPTELPAGLVLAVIPEREDVRDVLISRSGAKLHELARGAIIGSSSLRRSAQLLRARPDLRIEPLRGNLDTRIRKLRDGQFDGIVLAAAGLKRLGWADQITEYLSPTVLCPAVGQGALAVEACASDTDTLAALAPLEDIRARLGVTAERALLQRLGGGCQVPIAAHTTIDNGASPAIAITALVISPDGTRLTESAERVAGLTIEDAAKAGTRCADNLLKQGAADILKL